MGLRRDTAATQAIFDAWAGGSGCAARGAVVGGLAAWRGAGGWDLSAVDRGCVKGRATVLGGFAGVLVIDAVAVFALAYFARAIFGG